MGVKVNSGNAAGRVDCAEVEEATGMDLPRALADSARLPAGAHAYADRRAPIFIVGFQRSGTTLLRLMLNAHPEIAIPHDSAELWLDYRRRVRDYGDLREREALLRLIDDLRAEPRIRAWGVELPREALIADPLPRGFPEVMRRFHEVYARLQGKPRWGDKNTGTLTELDQLNAMFPDCRIVHLVRDGRDCALSHASREYVYGYANLLRTACEWREQVLLCRKMGAMLPAERYMELRYEDLIASPEVALRGVCRFLGLEFSPAMLDYHLAVERHIPGDKRTLWPLLDRPPQVDNAYKWKRCMDRADRACFERHAGALLRELGYETLAPPVHAGRLRELWYHLHGRFAWRVYYLLGNKPKKQGTGP
jgi:hypothetical protein